MNTSNIAKLTKRLISIPSVTGNTKEISRALALLSNVAEEKGLTSTTLNNNGVKTLWIKPPNSVDAKILLLCHIDVVSANKNDFVPEISMGRIIGRGAFDMKGSTSAMLHALTENIDTDTHLVITSDEEVGGKNGAEWFFNKTQIQPKIVIVPDGDDQNITSLQKGPMHIVFQVNGQSAHASRPWEGVNPIDTVITLKNIFASKFNNNKINTTCTLTNLKAESSINQISESATATFDIRATKVQDVDLIKKTIEKHATIIEIHGDGKILSQKEDKWIQIWQSIAKNTLRKPISLTQSCAASDARHAPSGATVIITQAFGGNAHSENEWVDITSLESLSLIANQFIKKVQENV